MKQLSLSRLNDICLSAVLAGDTPQQLIDAVFEYVGNPIICFDVTFHIIGFRFPHGFATESWTEIAYNGVASETSVIQGDYLSSQDKISSNTDPVFFDGDKPEVDFAQYCSSVYCGSRLCAYVGIGLGDGIPVQIRDCCRLLAKSIGLLLSKHHKTLLDAKQAEEIFSGFLDGSFDSTDILQFQQEHKPPYSLHVYSSDSAGQGTMEYTVSHLRDTFSDTLFCTRQGRIFGLSYNAEISGEYESFCLTDTEKAFMQNYQLNAGISDRFTKLTDIPLRQIQAQLALSYAKNHEKEYSSFAQDYISILSESTLRYYGKDASLSRYFQQILDLDLPWAVPTLKAYYNSAGRASKAAELLGVHKNTFTNRTAKLEDVTGHSLDDPEISQTLILDLHIYAAAEKGRRTK